MSKTVSAQKKFETLNQQYIKYVEELRREWLKTHRVQSVNVYEVMSSHERQKVQGRISQWERYITPLAEAWWAERGYGVKWPADNTKPMQVFELQTA